MAKNVVVKPKKVRTAEEVAVVLARRKLSSQQRLTIHALVMSTTRNEALALLANHGMPIDKSTLSRWLTKPFFREALTAAEAKVASLITRDSVLRKSEAALDKAMEGTPILGYTGPDTQAIVGYKPDLPSAARLIEIQGKAVGAFGDDAIKQLAVLVDVDFSGRKDEPVVRVEAVSSRVPVIIDGEIIDLTAAAEEEHIEAPAEKDDWFKPEPVATILDGAELQAELDRVCGSWLD